MRNINEIIKARRLELGLSLEDVAKVCGVNRSTIFKYENGNTEKMPTTILMPLARALRCTPTYLLGLEDEIVYATAGIDYIKVPLYSPICCGDGGFNDDNILDYIPVPSLKLSPRKEYFCQYAKGDSMKGAGIDNGDLLVFEKSSTIDNGMIGCFCVDENEAMCKKYTLVGGNIILMPMNSDYEPIAVDLLAFKCIGILKKVIKDF